LDYVDPEAIERPIHWEIHLIERFMIVMGPISTIFDVVTFALLLLLLRANEALFRTGWFVESLVTQILMIFPVRTRRHISPAILTQPYPVWRSVPSCSC
jgi:P-type Mg2+ transporter